VAREIQNGYSITTIKIWIYGGNVMITRYKLNFILPSALIAISSAAAAADIPKGTYAAISVVTASTCAKLSPTLAKGTTTLSSVQYPGAGKPGMVLGSAATATTGKPGSAASSVCTAGTAVPAKGLDGAALSFNCYTDTANALGTTATTLKSTFNVGPSHNPGIRSVTVSSSLLAGKTPLCKFTTDGTYALQ
jgi:hypothetical protein